MGHVAIDSLRRVWQCALHHLHRIIRFVSENKTIDDKIHRLLVLCLEKCRPQEWWADNTKVIWEDFLPNMCIFYTFIFVADTVLYVEFFMAFWVVGAGWRRGAGKSVLKRTVSRDGFGFWWHVWLALGQNRRRGDFFKFLGAPMIL